MLSHLYLVGLFGSFLLFLKVLPFHNTNLDSNFMVSCSCYLSLHWYWIVSPCNLVRVWMALKVYEWNGLLVILEHLLNIWHSFCFGAFVKCFILEGVGLAIHWVSVENEFSWLEWIDELKSGKYFISIVLISVLYVESCTHLEYRYLHIALLFTGFGIYASYNREGNIFYWPRKL